MANNGGRRKVGTGGISKKPKDVRATLKANRKNQEQRYASEAGPMATEEPAHTPLDQIPDLLKRYTDSYDQALRLLEPIVDNNGDLARHARDVPLAYRAQIEDRCQPQRIVPDPPDGIQDSVRFVRQWTSNTPYGNQARPYHLSNPFHHTGQFSDPSLTLCETVQIDWRLLSNSGQLADMICPVIGAGGWPFIPGSSIKGLFRRSCSPQQQLKWCGQESRQAISPGLLRFHGAWPQDISWTQGLLDLTHPQENWQVGIEDVNRHNANALISLLKPNLTIAISSTKPLEQSEWQEIKDILRNALRNGIGGRTAAGYGIPAEKEGESASDVSALLWTWKLRGQGPASKLLDGSPEFRPLMFRAAIRSMALRLFAGIVDSSRAQMEVKRLFGGFNPGAEPFVGLLATRFRNTQTPCIERFGVGPNSQNVYVCEGELSWHLINNREVDRDSLSKLLASLHALVLTLGGFGRSWRRPDHCLFMPSYRTRPIGCYWEWGEPPKNFTMPKTSEGIAGLLENAQSLAFTWLKSQYPDEFQSRTSCSRTDLPGWEQNRVSSKEKNKVILFGVR